MAKAVVFSILSLTIIFIGSAQCERMNVTTNGTGICNGGQYKYIADMKKGLAGCVVVVGYLELVFRPVKNNFSYMQFNDLREITEYLVIYRAYGLESVGQLFPALTRIRGNRLLDSYALIVYDNPNLREIALYNLLQIDRGGIIMWDSPQACYIDTIDWRVLAPKARHIISPSEAQVECNVPCNCPYGSKNRCWTNKKCQLFIEEERCHDQCLGCRKTAKDVCFTCRNYNHRFECVSECPPGTIVMVDNQYCITKQECYELHQFVWNNTCISECPIDYKLNNKIAEPTCEPCIHCEMNCSSLTIHSLGAIQNADKCVYIHGSLTIRMRYIVYAMDELKKYLNKIQEISDFIAIESSDVITSLDFLSSLRVIKGNKLKDNRYSLYVHNNINLLTLFTPEVTKKLVINNGTMWFQQNPVLCMNIIDEIKHRFPVPPTDLDIPLGSNGYPGGCEVPVNYTIVYSSETSIHIRFSIHDYNINYTVLYVRLSPDINSKAVPESCCHFEWHNVDIKLNIGQNYSDVQLKNLVPASTYTFCVEIFNPTNRQLSRSNMVNITTVVGTPEPPFILELVASTSNVVILRWTDHKNYIEHINNYTLEVQLLEMNLRESKVDYCKFKDDFFEENEIHHAVVRKVPPAYKRDCETMCGILSSVTPGAIAEEHFEVCDEYFSCSNSEESVIAKNSTHQNYVRTLFLNISGPRNSFQVGGLAPFSDYRFKLRACVDNNCSRSARGTVRTLRSKNSDVMSNISAHADALGYVTVKWETPKISNGPILSYSVEVLPKVNIIPNIMPHVICVQWNETMAVVKSVITAKYLVKVCLRTLATSRNCSDFVVAVAPVLPSALPISKMYLLWTGVLCGILMYIVTCLVGCLRIQRRVKSDTIPLVDSMSSYHVESEPPAQMLSDFMLFHTIPVE